MRKEFLATEHSDLEVQFYTKEHKEGNRWTPIWGIHPEKITLEELDSCNICEIKASLQMGANVFLNFKAFLLDRGFLNTGMLLNIKTDSQNQQYFLLFALEAVGDRFATCILAKDKITLDSTPPQKKYSPEEESFFSKFKKEEHT